MTVQRLKINCFGKLYKREIKLFLSRKIRWVFKMINFCVFSRLETLPREFWRQTTRIQISKRALSLKRMPDFFFFFLYRKTRRGGSEETWMSCKMAIVAAVLAANELVTFAAKFYSITKKKGARMTETDAWFVRAKEYEFVPSKDLFVIFGFWKFCRGRVIRRFSNLRGLPQANANWFSVY